MTIESFVTTVMFMSNFSMQQKKRNIEIITVVQTLSQEAHKKNDEQNHRVA